MTPRLYVQWESLQYQWAWGNIAVVVGRTLVGLGPRVGYSVAGLNYEGNRGRWHEVVLYARAEQLVLAVWGVLSHEGGEDYGDAALHLSDDGGATWMPTMEAIDLSRLRKLDALSLCGDYGRLSLEMLLRDRPELRKLL